MLLQEGKMTKLNRLNIALAVLLIAAPMSVLAQGAIGAALRPAAPGAQTLSGKRTAGARGAAGQASASGFGGALAQFALDVGRLPTTSEGLSVLVQPPTGVKNWKGPYIVLGPGKVTDKPFIDPWGNEYKYTNTTQQGANPTFEIRSAGPDGIYDNADDLAIKG